MKITWAELYVLLDAATGSIKIADGNHIVWRFSADQRREVANALLVRMNGEPIDVDGAPLQADPKETEA